MEHSNGKIKTLWLCSWYPDVMQPQNGDFVQRHAQATSQYAEVTTIHIAPCDPGKLDNQSIELVSNKTTHFSENILYYKKTSNSLFHRIKSVYQYFFQYKKWIDDYVKKNGKPDIVHLNVAWRDGIIALWIKKKYNIPYVLTEHWGFYHQEDGHLYENASHFFHFMIRKILKESSYILPVSNHLGLVLHQIYPNPNIEVIGNAVDTRKFKFCAKDNTVVFRFLHVSSLIPLKNISTIMNAFHEVNKLNPDTELYIIGGDKDQLSDYYNPNPNVIFLGTLPHEKVAEYMQICDCFVLFSLSENQPCVILESLCCGMPVISSDVGGISEIITPENGKLINIGDSNRLIIEMSNIIQEKSKYDSEKISKLASSRYDFSIIGAKINQIYQRVLTREKS